MKLQGKVVVVTGGGSGMGRELVLELLRRGASVSALDINPSALAETEALCGAQRAKLMTRVVNIADLAAVAAVPQAVVDRFGVVDGLINCAGIIQPFIDLNALDYATIERVFDVNWRGTLYMTKTFLPLLLDRPTAHLVNVSSMGGFMPFPGQSAYGASKAAVKLLTEALNVELAQTRVRVSIVFPGAVATNIIQNSGVPGRPAADAKHVRMRLADEAARDILNGMERDKFRILVGSDAKLLDVLSRLSPVRAAKFIAKQMKRALPK